MYFKELFSNFALKFGIEKFNKLQPMAVLKVFPMVFEITLNYYSAVHVDNHILSVPFCFSFHAEI